MFETITDINEILSWNMLKQRSFAFSYDETLKLMILNRKQLKTWVSNVKEDKYIKLFCLLVKYTPVQGSPERGYQYMHNSIQQFFVQQSFLREVRQSGGASLNPSSSKVGSAFFMHDLEILPSIGREIQLLSNSEKD